MTPAQVAHIMALVNKLKRFSHPIDRHEAAEVVADIEAALRDAPQQADPTDPEDCHAWCPRCDGTGDEVQMSDSSPDAHEVTVNCRHCDGAGTLYAAYNGVVRELAKKHQAYIKACGEIYFSKLKTPSAPTAVEPDDQRYQLLRRGQHWSVIDGVGDVLRGDDLDAAVDSILAARLAKDTP